MTDKITKALETVNELHGETLRKMDDDPYSFAAFLNFHYAAYQEQLKYIDNLRAEVAKYKAIASKAIREQIDVRKDERERCAKVALDTYSDKDRMKYVHDTYTSGFSDCKLKIHRAIMETGND